MDEQNQKTPGLEVLAVIDRLEVGPPRLSRNKVVTPYRVITGDKVETTELTYRFEEDVFVPGEPASENLAAMITAQVALNYGLFCDEIVFFGPFDKADRRFLQDMGKNTSREIYVKKFLEPNPFLRGAAAGLKPEKRPHYLHSRLVFRDPPPPEPQVQWITSKTRHCVLSSGGKDSLLTFGLMRELGLEPHPVFVNESGRHWFTALNAYRHMKETVPQTGRVWTDGDRLFAWMLRHLPFIRPDFAEVRADNYPIRLWTVAVFLFGALPVMRKRGISRLLIGDEFDTTERRTFEGIPHYEGLFDQSRYFDEYLSRYFHKKGWQVAQFSILRPLSELLIQKTLAERYPDLLAHQVSCHAAHMEGERIKPCGKCEKCRRIVGMLTAMDMDPGVCGYTRAQISDCLAALGRGGIHQEDNCASQTAFMLASRGLLQEGRIGQAKARPVPEVLKLRFDREHSPLNWIPEDLRHPLYQLWLEHASSAAIRSGRAWREVDLFSLPEASAPYGFEGPDAARAELVME